MRGMVKDRGKRHRCLIIAGWVISYLLVMFWGVAIVKWQVPPYGAYVWAKHVLGYPKYLGPFAEVSNRYAFVGPLVEAENQIDPPVQNTEQLDERVKKLEMDVSRFLDAFSSINLLNASFLKPNVFSLNFEIGRNYSTYCYFESGQDKNKNTAILIIPGSGFNQSGEIMPGGFRNYHDGLFDTAKKYGDVYVYIKPNEDIRAIHNGRNKLDYDFITNTLISHGGSYSAYYVVETMAITKYLQKYYRNVVVAGISQGGTAALLNGMQSWPNAVICISGGYYPSKSYVAHASPFNIMIPDINNIVDPDSIPGTIRNHRTKWLFTIGKGETGEFRILAEENILSKRFQGIEQVNVKVHGGGHVVPVQVIDDYLHEIIR